MSMLCFVLFDFVLCLVPNTVTGRRYIINLLTLREQRGSPQFSVGLVLFIVLALCAVLCFCFVCLYPQFFVGGLMSYLRYSKTKDNKTKTIQRNCQHRVTKTKDNKTKTIQRNCQHRVTKRKDNKTKTIQRNWPYVASFSGLFLFCYPSSWLPYVDSFSGLFLFCYPSSWLPYVASFSGLFLFCYGNQDEG
jgi:hypothetical protein